MKLLFCKECCDLKALTQYRRMCVCRKSFGRYLPNGKARYGGPALLLGIDNKDVEGNLRAPVTETGPEIILKIYRIPETASTVEYVGGMKVVKMLKGNRAPDWAMVYGACATSGHDYQNRDQDHGHVCSRWSDE